MSTFSIQVDAAGFERQLKQYQQATQKDMAYVVNRAMNSWAIHGARVMKEAMESKIRGLQSQPWWPKFIAKVLSKVKTEGARKRFWASKSRSMARLARQSHYTKLQAQRFSAKVINKRLRARTFVRGFFLRWSQALSVACHGKGFKGPRGIFSKGDRYFAGVQATYIPATPRNLTASVHVWYDYKKRSGKGISMVHAMFEKAKAIGLARTLADMQQYVRKLVSERAGASNLSRAA